MAIEGFIDTITNYASLNVTSNILKDTKDYLKSSTFLLLKKSCSEASWISSPSLIKDNTTIQTVVLQEHSANDISKFVLNITSLNILSDTFELNPLLSPTFEFSSLSYIVEDSNPTPNYISNASKNYFASETDLYIETQEDFLELDWNVETNQVYNLARNFNQENQDPGGGDGNNNATTIKEFWA